jgi:hypothetical protein
LTTIIYKVTIQFIDDIPDDTNFKPVLISGSTSANYSNQKYLRLIDDHTAKGLYEIKYQAHCSPFEEALLVDNLLAVGHEEHFYLFNIVTNQNVLRLKMNGYFGHLYFDAELFYVADASGLHCIDKTGNIRWSNLGLAIDGVIVNEFTGDKIIGSGELDPPGGWEDFSIDKVTGIRTT